MAEVTLKISAESQEALRRVKEFTRGIEDTWAKVRAGDPALQGSSVKVLDLARAKGEATRATHEWRGALSQLPGPLGDVTRQGAVWLNLLRGPAGMVVGLGAVAAATVGFAKSMANNIERLDNLSRVTGLSVAALESFEHIAKQAGAAPEELARGLGAINTAISDVIKGGDGASKSFRSIGVDLRTLVKDGASTEEILEQVAKAIASIPDPTRQAAAMADLFGTRSKALQLALQKVATDGIQPLIAEMKRMGVVTSEEGLAAARKVDEMADRFDAGIDRIIKKSKQFAVEGVVGVASDLDKIATMLVANYTAVLAAVLAARASIGLASKDAADQAQRTAEAAAKAAAAGSSLMTPEAANIRGERPPPQDAARKPRDTAATAAEQAEAKQRAAAFDDAIRKSIGLENATRQLNDGWKEGAELGTRYAEATRKIELDELTKDAQRAVASFEDWTPSIRTNAEGLRASAAAAQNYRSVVGGLVGMSEDYVRVGDEIVHTNLGIRGGLASLEQVSMETGEGFSILTGELTNFDVELARGQALAEGVPNTLRRMVPVLETELPSAFKQFTTGLATAGTDLKGQFQDWTQIGRQTAGDLFNAFDASFFQAMKGNLDSFDDIWKAALDAVLRQISAFLASAAVNGLLNLGADFLKGLGSSSGSGSGTSSGGINVGDLVGAAAAVSGLVFGQQAQTRATLELTQTIRGASLALSQLGGAASSAAHDVGGGQAGSLGPAPGSPTLGKEITGFDPTGGMRAGSITGSLLGPGIGVVAGIVAGLEIDGKTLGSRIGNAVLDLVDRVFGTDLGPGAQAAANQAGVAASQFNDASRKSVEAFDGMTAAAQNASQAAANTAAGLTGFAGDLSQMDPSLGAAREGLDKTTTGLGGFSDGLEGLGKGIAGAVEAADRAARDARDAADAAGSGGTGPSGTGGGGPGGGSGAFLHGGWVGRVRGYAPGGWINDGVFGRDSVPAMLARNEFVLTAHAANYDREFTEAYNRNPARAIAGVAATGGGGDGSGPAILAALLDQNRLIREQNELIRRRPSRGVGDHA